MTSAGVLFADICSVGFLPSGLGLKLIAWHHNFGNMGTQKRCIIAGGGPAAAATAAVLAGVFCCVKCQIRPGLILASATSGSAQLHCTCRAGKAVLLQILS